MVNCYLLNKVLFNKPFLLMIWFIYQLSFALEDKFLFTSIFSICQQILSLFLFKGMTLLTQSEEFFFFSISHTFFVFPYQSVFHFCLVMNVTVLCIASSNCLKWYWWPFLISKLCSLGKDLICLYLNYIFTPIPMSFSMSSY
jgi:hypothetical protein